MLNTETSYQLGLQQHPLIIQCRNLAVGENGNILTSGF